MGQLEGRTALVTGGSRGIGAAIATHLAREGATVAVNYARSRDRAEDVVRSIEAAGGQAFTVAGDVGAPDDVAAMYEAIDQRFGGSLDVLVNNAGIFELFPVTEGTLEDFDRTMHVNVRGVYDVTRHAAQRLRDNGRIVTVGSIMGDRAMTPGAAVYAMSKAAVAGLSRGWAHDLGPRGITVNTVQPGPIDTELNPDRADNPMADPIKQSTTLKRYGTADEVASLVTWLATPASQYVTGQTLTVDGGLDA